MDSYFNRPEVSNSDLTELKKLLLPQQQRGDIEAAYRFGTLVDAMITEHHKVDYFNRKVEGVALPYTESEFDTALRMKKSAEKNPLLQYYFMVASFQKVQTADLDIDFNGNKFTMKARCKWDLFFDGSNFGGDIKSTAATTRKGFLDTIDYFDYDRQRAWYMDIGKTDRDLLIGISKVNYEVFVVNINRESSIYKRGLAKYQELAYKYYQKLMEVSK